jgi:diaminopimelate decarboxylase
MRTPLAWLDWTAKQWEDLVSAHGTPLYVFDAEFVRQRVRSVKAGLGNGVGVYYAVKANPNLALLRLVRDTVDGVDIASGGELRQALAAGYAAIQVSYAGPAKTEVELRSAIEAGVGSISVESVREINACARIASGLGKPAQIIIRVNPTLVHKGFGLKMAGRAMQFGIDECDLIDVERLLRERRRDIVCNGIHSYVGSQCFDGAGILDATANALRIARELESRTGWPCRKLNLGGGFGVAQAGERKELQVDAISEEMRKLLDSYLKDRPNCEAFFELGRYITAESGIYVTRVIDVKVSRGTPFALCDGGLNHQLAAAGTFGAALRGNFPLLNLSRPDAPILAFNVAGPSCNPTDLLGVQSKVPEPKAGDLIGVAMSGSYGLTASPLLFLGHDTPTELVLDGSQVLVGRNSHNLLHFN